MRPLSTRIRGQKRKATFQEESALDVDYDSVIHRGETVPGDQRPPKSQKTVKKKGEAFDRSSGNATLFTLLHPTCFILAFFKNDLRSYVYNGNVFDDDSMAEGHFTILNSTHRKPVEFCAKNRSCGFTTLSNSLQDPLKPVWGDRRYASAIAALTTFTSYSRPLKPFLDDRRYATAIAALDKGGQFDWRFHLGFGQRFSFDGTSQNHYYCIGFVYGGITRGKFMIAYEEINGEIPGLSSKKRRYSAGDSPGSGVRLYSVNQLVPVDIPRVVGDILSANEATQAAFFTAVQQLFSSNALLPDETKLEKDQVQLLFSTYFFRLIAFSVQR